MTNEILSIVLYFVSGVAVTSIVMVILGIKNEIKELRKQEEELKLHSQTNNALFREVEELHRRVGDENDKISRSIHEQNGEIYRYIDSNINEVRQQSSITNDGIYRYIDSNINEIRQQSSIINDGKQRSIEEIYRYVDSRLDKLENKLIDIIKNGCEPVESK